MSGGVAGSVTGRIDLAFSDPEASARAWKKSGGKVIAFLGATVPVELIAETRLLPTN
jgi:hypothetical protein